MFVPSEEGQKALRIVEVKDGRALKVVVLERKRGVGEVKRGRSFVRSVLGADLDLVRGKWGLSGVGKDGEMKGL